MIPKIQFKLNRNNSVSKIDDKGYKMDMDRQLVRGSIEGIDLVRQAVFKILNTERYNYYIYTSNYGIELNDLLGEPISYVCPEVERRIREALEQDDRIISVDSFDFVRKGKVLNVTFNVDCLYGNFKGYKEIEL